MRVVNNWNGVPQEVVHEQIFSFLSLKDIQSFMYTGITGLSMAKYHFKMLLQPMKASVEDAKVKSLYMEQIHALICMNKLKSNLFIKSPMGSGKTLMGLIQAIHHYKETGKSTLIIATTKCLSSWLKHVKMCGLKLIKSNAERSDVLLVHASAKDHRDYLMNFDKNIYSVWKHPIIITTQYYASNRSYPVKIVKLENKNILDQIIIDEAHLFNNEQHHLQNSSTGLLKSHVRRIFLSASHVAQRDYRYRYLNQSFHSRNYDIMFDLSMLKNKKSTIPTLDISEIPINSLPTDDEFMDEIFSMLTTHFKDKKRIAFVGNWNPNFLKTMFNSFKNITSEYKFYRLSNTNNRVLDIMRKQNDQKYVMFVPIMSATEGVNMEMIDSLLLVDFGCATPKRGRQCLGRFRRRNNINDTIHCVFAFFEKYKVSYIRMKMNIFIASNLELNEDEIRYKSKNTIEKTALELQILGYNIYDLTLIDLFLLFGSYNNKEFIFTHLSDKDISIHSKDLFRLMSLEDF